MRNTYFVTCPYCGSHLDPGERCDCDEGQLLRLKAEEHRGRLFVRRHGKKKDGEKNDSE